MVRIRQLRISSEQAIAWSTLAVVTGFVLWHFHPHVLFADTTPVSSDLGSHVMAPAYLREHLLPHGRLTGWSPDWFTGYPIFTFYFPMMGIVPLIFDTVLPYNVAYKLAAVSGPLTLPLVGYAFGRLNRRSRATAAGYGVAMLIVLLQPRLWRVGGTIWSAATGEFSYGISLSAGLLTLGMASAGLRTGRYRALTGACLGVTMLSHTVPTATVFLGLAVLTLTRFSWAKVRWTASVVAVGVGLAGFWLVPLLLRLDMTSGPDSAATTAWADVLFLAEMAPVIIVALAGLAVTAFLYLVGETRRRDDVATFLAWMALTSFLLFALLPTAAIEDIRFLPCWFLWLSLLAANAISRLAEFLDNERLSSARGRPLASPQLGLLLTPVALFAAIVLLWGSGLGEGLLHPADSPAVREFTKTHMSGYQRGENRREFQGFIDATRSIAHDKGCGRAIAEWNEGEWDGARQPFADMTAYWTDGCIASGGGLTMQSSPTTPFLRAARERVSFEAVALEGERKPFDLPAGIGDFRLLGIRYLIASHPSTQRSADSNPDLRLVAEAAASEGKSWRFYEVRDVEVVQPLQYEPMVVPSLDRSRKAWDRAARPWFETGPARDVPLAVDGPPEWLRADSVPDTLPRRPLPATTVSNVVLDRQRIAFDVADVGIPILVKVSYFPNWRAKGADGPWRVTPNHMVVVPRSNTVQLDYGRSLPEHVGSVASLASVGGLVALARRPPVEMPVPAVEPEPEKRRPPRAKAKRKPKRRKPRR